MAVDWSMGVADGLFVSEKDSAGLRLASADLADF